MGLQAGDRLGPYEILGRIGAGGMGEVYRARDARLDRSVAIKVLPDAVAHDAERLARFDREARTLAALNHTNIAQVYGLEGGALAMEFVEGEDLSAHIARGPIPLGEALDLAGQVANALDAAHEMGIVHRDLKPSNIRVREDGVVKVLDFGLAKALAPPTVMTDAPTVTSPAMTERGTILGTAAYMAPEQARGKIVDKRADIWAFGVLLYEMTTGRRPFEGESVSESLASVLKSDPDWAPVPPALQRLLRSCLEKDPKKRLRDVGDWRRLLDDAASGAPGRGTRLVWWWVATAVLAVTAGAIGVIHFSEAPPAARPVTFQIQPPEKAGFSMGFAVSPDGARVAFSARGPDEIQRIWVRDLDTLQARPVAGTDGARTASWSPDGRSVIFVVGRLLKRVAIDGGASLTLYEAQGADAVGVGAWNREGVIIFGGTRSGAIRRVSEGGGPATPLTAVDRSRGEAVHGLPTWLPDGRHFLYTRVSTDPAVSGVFVGSIDRTPDSQDVTRLLPASHAIYAETTTGAGHLLYLRQGTLVSHPFDAGRRALIGEPVPMAEGVGNFGSMGFFSVGGGTLAYRKGDRLGSARDAQLTWMDRKGTRVAVVGRPASYDGLRLSPDGGRAAVVVASAPDGGLSVDLWIVELARGVSRRLTSNQAPDRAPVWSPKGDRIAFLSPRAGMSDLYVTAADGSGAEELLLRSDHSKTPTSWSRDGGLLLFNTYEPPNASNLWVLPLGRDAKASPYLQTRFSELEACFSPDMEWIAYTSNESERNEVYVRRFASTGSAAGGAIPVSKDGGAQPRWRQDGRELIFLGPGGAIMSVDLVLEGGQLRPQPPTLLFTIPDGANWDVTADGKRFLVAMPSDESVLAPLTVTLNWK